MYYDIIYIYYGGDIMYHIRESIRPSADLRNHYNEISKQCREENEAVIITVNGRIWFLYLMMNTKV